MKIHELFTDKSKWTRLAMARAANGEAVHELSPKATCWCLEGAMVKCYGSFESKIADVIREKVGRICSWNDADDRTFEEVQSLVKELDV